MKNLSFIKIFSCCKKIVQYLCFVTVHKLNKFVLNIHHIKVINIFKCFLEKFLANVWL
jgi:hypothetical protein